ncbi:PRIM1, partial [Symbiodinium natans]
DFNRELLKIYYDKFFPFLAMFRWLSYRNDPKSASTGAQKDFFNRREFDLVLQGDAGNEIHCRYTCFKDAEEYRSRVLERQPIRMEIGAVYSHPPVKHKLVMKDAYKPLERELVFDIDMDDYDDIRSCCTGAKLCVKCWTFMKAAIEILRRALREDFGFDHLLFVYSGRRGVHCWVCDAAARRLNNEQRSALAEYMTMVTPGAGKCRADLKLTGMEELHPAVSEAYTICKKWFRDDPNCILNSQDILRAGPHLPNILEPLVPSERDKVTEFMKKHPEASSKEIWAELEKIAEERDREAVSFKQKSEAKVLLKDVTVQFAYPRLDVNVTKQINHLLKSPFVVHPKTGRVCVPIDPDHLNDFDPSKVPTIGHLVEEFSSTQDVNKTSLRPYLHFFETGFLQKLEAKSTEEIRALSDAKTTGALMVLHSESCLTSRELGTNAQHSAGHPMQRLGLCVGRVAGELCRPVGQAIWQVEAVISIWDADANAKQVSRGLASGVKSMTCKVYAHVDVGGYPSFALPIQVGRPEETQFGTLKQALLKEIAQRVTNASELDYDTLCFWNQDLCPIPDSCSVAAFAWEHNDFFLRPTPASDSAGSALNESRAKRGELSYYYAHNRDRRSLIAKPQATSQPARLPMPVKVVAPSGPTKFNTKQSPFGTDITKFETLDSYTWEDNDGETVKVLVPLDGVGKLSPEKVRSHFGERSFELLVEGIGGRNVRFACYKTHGELKPEECKHVVRANRVNLILRKAKEKDHWFDLFKKRAIGDDDDP